MNQQEIDGLLELQRDRQLTAAQDAYLQELLATNPDARAYWDSTKAFDQRIAATLNRNLEAARLPLAAYTRIQARLASSANHQWVTRVIAAGLLVLALIIGVPPLTRALSGRGISQNWTSAPGLISTPSAVPTGEQDPAGSYPGPEVGIPTSPTPTNPADAAAQPLYMCGKIYKPVSDPTPTPILSQSEVSATAEACQAATNAWLGTPTYPPATQTADAATKIANAATQTADAATWAARPTETPIVMEMCGISITVRGGGSPTPTLSGSDIATSETATAEACPEAINSWRGTTVALTTTPTPFLEPMDDICGNSDNPVNANYTPTPILNDADAESATAQAESATAQAAERISPTPCHQAVPPRP